METNQIAETWTDFMDRFAATDECLSREVLEEISDELRIEDAVAEISGYDDSKRHQRVIKRAQQLINQARRTSKQVVAAIETVSPCSATNAVASAPMPEKTAEKASSVTYPDLPFDLSSLDHEELVARAVELAVEYRKDKNYLAIRDEFVQVSLALNQFGLLAPVFRDQPKMPFKRTEWKHCTQLLIDQIVIDCHWLYCRKESVSPRWSEFKPMFAPGGEFDCQHVAERIGAKNWKDDFRVNELFLLYEQQKVQLMQLRDKALKEKFRVLLDGRATFEGAERGREAAKVAAVRVAINNYAANSRGKGIRGQEDIYEGIWLALELLGTKAKNGDIATLAALKCGTKPVQPRTMSGKVVTLRKLLGEAGIALGS